MKDKLHKILMNHSSNYLTHGYDGLDIVIFEHNFNELIDDILKIIPNQYETN